MQLTDPPRHGGNLRWAATVVGCDSAEILDFSASINPLGLPTSARTALIKGLDGLTHYPDPNCTELRALLGQHHHLPPDWILVGNGAAELLTWIARDCQTTQPVGLLTPAFADYARALQAFAVNVVACPLPLTPGQTPNLATLLPQTLQSIIINNPHNPTGQLWTAAELLTLVQERDWGLVVVDEAFMDFLGPGQSQSLMPWVQQFPNLVILRSLTKFYAIPGLRIGYAIAPPERLKRWQAWRDPWTVNSLALIAAAVALKDADYHTKTWAWLTPARQELYRQLRDFPRLLPWPSAANFLLVHSQESVKTLQIQLLHQARILIRDCLSFPELGDHYFRVAVRTRADNQRLIQALQAIVN